MMFRYILPISIIVFTTTSSFAETPSPQGNAWSYTLGLGGVSKPEYIGSNTSKRTIMPFASATYNINEKHKISIGIPETGYTYQTKKLLTGVKLGYASGRKSSDDKRLTGLNDIDPYAILSPFITYKIQPNLGVTVQPNVPLTSDVDGYTTDVKLTHKKRLLPRLHISTSAGFTYADESYVDSHFSAPQNTAVHRTAFHANDAGIYKYNLNVKGFYRIDKNRILSAQIGLEKLAGEARKSSLTQNETQPSILFGYAYKF